MKESKILREAMLEEVVHVFKFMLVEKKYSEIFFFFNSFVTIFFFFQYTAWVMLYLGSPQGDEAALLFEYIF